MKILIFFFELVFVFQPRISVSFFSEVFLDSHTQELKIHMKHFEDAIKKIRPLSTQELNMYKGIADQFGKPELRAAATESVGTG